MHLRARRRAARGRAGTGRDGASVCAGAGWGGAGGRGCAGRYGALVRLRACGSCARGRAVSRGHEADVRLRARRRTAHGARAGGGDGAGVAAARPHKHHPPRPGIRHAVGVVHVVEDFPLCRRAKSDSQITEQANIRICPINLIANAPAGAAVSPGRDIAACTEPHAIAPQGPMPRRRACRAAARCQQESIYAAGAQQPYSGRKRD